MVFHLLLEGQWFYWDTPPPLKLTAMIFLKYYFQHFHCQAIIDNGSDTSYKFTRSSPLHINLKRRYITKT